MDLHPGFGRALVKALYRLLAAALTIGSPLASAAINTWSSVGPEGGEMVKAVYNPATPTTVYAIAASGFHRSVDAGATWQLTKSDFLNPPSDMEVDPSDPTRVYVVSGSPKTLWVSTDSGVVFNSIAFPNVGNAFQIELSADGQTIYASSATRIFRSDNRGTDWSERTSVGVAPGIVSRLLIDPTNKETVYAVAATSINSSGLFVSHNGAATWTLLSAAAPAGYIFDIVVPASNPNRIWIGGEHGLYVSSNAGANFSLNYSPLLSGAVHAIGLNPADPTNLYIGEPYGFIYKTTNEGATWTDVSGNGRASQVATIAVRPESPSHVLVAGYSGLFLSTTGGTTWTRRDAGIIATTVQSLSADTAADRIYFSAGGTGIHYLAGGATRSTPVNNAQLAQLDQIPTAFFVASSLAQSSPSGRIFAGYSNQVARSLDGGATWALTSFPLGRQPTVLASPPLNSQLILAGLTSSLYRSGDGGDTWAAATSGLPANVYVDSVAFSASNPSVAYVAPKMITASVSQAFGVYRSSDGGLTWSAANGGIDTLAAAALAVHPLDPQIVYVSAEQKLWRTTDGGANWTERPWKALGYPFPSAIALDPVRPSTLYVSGPQLIARSIDSGDSWELLTPPATSSTPPWVPSALLPDPLRPHVVLAATQRFGVQQITIAPDLALDLDQSPGATLAVGQAITLRFTAQNLGPFHATGAKVRLDIPPGLQNVSIESSPGSCAIAAPTITCTYDILRAGLSAAITLKATPVTEGALQFTGTIAGDQADPAAANNAQSYNATVVTKADISVASAGTLSAQVGSAVTHTLTVQNAGPNAATAVQLTHQLGTGLTATSANATVGNCTVTTSSVTCTLGDMAAASIATITVSGSAATAGTAVSNTTVSTSAVDPSAANNSTSITTTVTAVPVTPPPSSPSASGGGGGGSLSFWWVLFLGVMVAWRISQPRLRPATPRPNRTAFPVCKSPDAGISPAAPAAP